MFLLRKNQLSITRENIALMSISFGSGLKFEVTENFVHNKEIFFYPQLDTKNALSLNVSSSPTVSRSNQAQWNILFLVQIEKKLEKLKCVHGTVRLKWRFVASLTVMWQIGLLGRHPCSLLPTSPTKATKKTVPQRQTRPQTFDKRSNLAF